MPNIAILERPYRPCFGTRSSVGLTTKWCSGVCCRNRPYHSIAQGLDTAAQNVKELQGGAGATSQREVHRVTSQQAFQNKGKPGRLKGNSASACYQCGKSGHGASQCRFKSAKCHRCGKKGHIRVVCHSKPKPAGHSHSVQQVHVKREMLTKERKMRKKEAKKEAPRAPVVVMPPPPSPGRQFVDFLMRNFSNGQRVNMLICSQVHTGMTAFPSLTL